MGPLVSDCKEMRDWLKRANILHDGQAVTRIVIDLQVKAIAKIYVEMNATHDLLKITPPDMSGAEITILESD